MAKKQGIKNGMSEVSSGVIKYVVGYEQKKTSITYNTPCTYNKFSDKVY